MPRNARSSLLLLLLKHVRENEQQDRLGELELLITIKIFVHQYPSSSVGLQNILSGEGAGTAERLAKFISDDFLAIRKLKLDWFAFLVSSMDLLGAEIAFLEPAHAFTPMFVHEAAW